MLEKEISVDPKHDKTIKMTCAPSKESGQPGHPPSLIRIFTSRMKKPWVLSYPLSAQRRLIRLGGCPCWVHMSFCCAAAHLSTSLFKSFQPCHEKTCLRGLRPVKTQTGLISWWGLEIPAVTSRGILSRQRTTRVLISLRGCAGWSAPLLFISHKQVFSWCGSYVTNIINECYKCKAIMAKYKSISEKLCLV